MENKKHDLTGVTLFILGLFCGAFLVFVFLYPENFYTKQVNINYESLIIYLCEINNLHDDYILTANPYLPFETNYTSTRLICEDLIK